jgi:hypothetical protein
VRLWHAVVDHSPATRRRWPWTWGGDDRVFQKSGPQLGLVGTRGGQAQRVRLEIDGLVVVSDAGPRGRPVDVTGQRPEVVWLSDGRRVAGQERPSQVDWPWRDRLQLPGRRSARRTATNPTCGSVTVVIVNEPAQQGDSRHCQATALTAPRLILAWTRRSWIAPHGRTLTPLLATAACQVRGEDADDGPVVLQLLAGSCSTPLADSSRGAGRWKSSGSG